LSHTDNYEPLGPSTVADTFKTVSELQADDHSQPHRNFYESTRSVIERSTTISRGDNFTQANPELIPQSTPHPFVCNANDGFSFAGIGDLATWNPATNKILNLNSGGVYFVIINFEMDGAVGGQEIIGDIIDDSDGITVIGVGTPLDIVSGSDPFHDYQMIFNFRAPAGVEGKTFTLSLFTDDIQAELGLRSITIHRDR